MTNYKITDGRLVLTDVNVPGDLDLYGTQITSLPEGLSVGGDLYLTRTPITALPAGLSVGGGLYLSGTQITSLPEGLSVSGDLDLYGMQITSLPAGLSVGGDLYLTRTRITSLPEDIGLRGKRIADAPAIPDIHRAIQAAVAAHGIDMSDWHCETTHCRAGWAVTLAGKAGKTLEDEIGTANAAYLIYAASDPRRPVPDFYASDEDALADIKRCAEGAA